MVIVIVVLVYDGGQIGTSIRGLCSRVPETVRSSTESMMNSLMNRDVLFFLLSVNVFLLDNDDSRHTNCNRSCARNTSIVVARVDVREGQLGSQGRPKAFPHAE